MKMQIFPSKCEKEKWGNKVYCKVKGQKGEDNTLEAF